RRQPRRDRAHAHRTGVRRGHAADRHDGTPLSRLGPAATDGLSPLEARPAAGHVAHSRCRIVDAGRALRGAALMRVISLLFHDVYASEPAESGFISAAANRYK